MRWGASRWQVVRPMLLEGALISLLGAVAGLGIAYGGLRLINAVAFEAFLQTVGIDQYVLAFTALLAFVTPLLFTLWPALSAGRSMAADTRQGTRVAGNRSSRRGRNALVASQVALALALLVVSALAVQSLLFVQRMELGVETDSLLVWNFALPADRYPDAASQAQFMRTLEAELSAIGGTEGSAIASHLPVFDSEVVRALSGTRVDSVTEEDRPWASRFAVTPGFFDVVDIDLIGGRGFNPDDDADGQPVAILNQLAAERYFSSVTDAIGRSVTVHEADATGRQVAIVGVVTDTRDSQVNSTSPQMYVPLAQAPEASVTAIVRAGAETVPLATDARAVMRRLDPGVAVFDLKTIPQLIRERLSSRTILNGLFHVVRRACAGARLGGIVCRHFLLGRPAWPRDWHPAGAGRVPHERRQVGPERGASRHGGRRRRRSRAGPCVGTRLRAADDRCHGVRSRHVRNGRCCHRRGGPRRQLEPGDSRDARRSGALTPGRVMTPHPPQLARWLVATGTRPEEREFLLGDLEEQFGRQVRRRGLRHGRRWYWRQAIAAAWHLGRRRSRRPHHARPDATIGDPAMHHLTQDLRFAARQLRRQPSFVAVAVLSLAVAIGANGLAYGLVDNLIFNPFEFPQPDRVISVGSTFPQLGQAEGFIEQHSPAEIDDFRRASSIAHVAAFDLGNRAVSNGTSSERVFTALVLDDPFPALAKPPTLGRGFTPDELAPDAPPVAIISHRLWTTMFAADENIIGSAIMMNGSPRTVVGVTGEGPALLGTDLWIPWGADPLTMPRNIRQFTLVARLAPGASLDDLNAELAALASRTTATYRDEHPEYAGWSLRAVTWTEAVTGQLHGSARLLLVAGILVLLIACANLTGLMLARLNARRREIAVRYALGAGGWQVLRLLLAESLAIAGVATGLGLLLAQAGLSAMPGLLPTRVVSLGATPEIDFRVIVYCSAVALLAALITTVVPAWQARRATPQGSLRDGGTATVSRQRIRSALVVAELALAVILLVGAGLFLRSFSRIQQVDPGFDPANMLAMRLTLPPEHYDLDATRRFFLDAADRIAALPDVTSAAAAAQLPPVKTFTTQFQIDGAPSVTETALTAFFTTVTPDFFEVLGVRVRHGRGLTEADRAGAPLVAVVNDAFVTRYLGGQPEGRIVFGENTTADVVGVVTDTSNDTLLRPARPEIFVSYSQAPYNNQMFLVIRTRTEPLSVFAAARQALAEIDPDQPPYVVQSMEQALAGSVSTQRISLVLVGIFAVVAVVVAGIGVFGVVAYWVASRSREIGIRQALGATRRQVAGLVLGQAARLMLVGATLGLVGGVFAGRAAESQLFEIRGTDPVAIGGAAALLVIIGLVASWLPSRRAMRLDPAKVLRSE